MPRSGKDLGVDLYELWRAGQDNLPSVADEYADAARYLASTDSGLSNAFMRPDRFGGGTFGPVHGPWTALRDELHGFLNDTATNLKLTGEALCLAAQLYAETDRAAADEFDRLRAANSEPAG